MRFILSKTMWFSFLFSMFISFFVSATKHKRLKKSDLPKLFAKARAKYVKKSIKSDGTVRSLQKKEASLTKERTKSRCTSGNVPWVTKSCSKKCLVPKMGWSCKKKVLGRCLLKVPVRVGCKRYKTICVPKTTRKNVRLCIVFKNDQYSFTVNGKRTKVGKSLRKLADKLRAKTRQVIAKIDTTARKVRHHIKERSKAIAKAAEKKFQAAVAKMKSKAKALAKKLIAAQSFKDKYTNQVIKLLWKHSRKAKDMTSPKIQQELKKALAEKKNHKELKKLMHEKKKGRDASKAYAKGVGVKIAKGVAFEALRISFHCFYRSGSGKKSCLKKWITGAMKDLTFDVAVAFVAVAIDLSVNEPMSHTGAALITTAVAAASAGVAAPMAYPISYIALSLALNLAQAAFFEFVLRKAYEKRIYKPKLKSAYQSLASSIVSRLPKKLLACHAPKKFCK